MPALAQGIQNRFGLIFFILLFLSLLSLSSLPIWAESMLLFRRERDAGAYSTTAYYAARVLFDAVPLRTVPPLFFMLITYPMVGLHTGSMRYLLSFGGVLVLGNVASTLLCMLLGVAMPSMSLSNLARPSARPASALPAPPSVFEACTLHSSAAHALAPPYSKLLVALRAHAAKDRSDACRWARLRSCSRCSCAAS